MFSVSSKRNTGIGPTLTILLEQIAYSHNNNVWTVHEVQLFKINLH